MAVDCLLFAGILSPMFLQENLRAMTLGRNSPKVIRNFVRAAPGVSCSILMSVKNSKCTVIRRCKKSWL